MKKSFIRVVAIFSFGLIHAGGVLAAEVPEDVSAAIKKFQVLPNYSWTTTTEMPDAPFRVLPVSGMADTNGFAVLTSTAGKKVAVAKGDMCVLKTSSGWKTAAVLGEVKDPADGDLLNTKTPPDELAVLVPKLSGWKPEGENAFSGELESASAKIYLLSSMKGRGPGGFTPKIQSSSGKFQLWLKDGFPQKYTLVINASVSLPFGTKAVTRISTTEITDVGKTKFEVPAEAQSALEK